jgi:hypothetical protein
VTVTLTLKPEVEAGLLSKAQISGMALEEYLQSLVEESAAPAQKATPSKQATREEAVRRMLEFGKKYHLSLGEPITGWRDEYNCERPHSSLGYRTPNEFAEVLKSSMMTG